MRCTQTFVLVVAVFFWQLFLGSAMASEHQPANILEKIVYGSIEVLQKNGFNMLKYDVRNGSHTDLPLSSGPPNIGFFAHKDTSWIGGGASYKMNFYEVDKIPVAARMQLIAFLVKLHEAEGRSFTLTLRMMRDQYKKPEIIKPAAYIELKLNQIER